MGWQWNLPGLEILGSDITYHDGAASLLVDWNSVFRDGLPTGKVAQTSKAPSVPDEAANRARFEQYREELANQEHLDAVQAQMEESGSVIAGGPKATEFRDRVRIAEQYGGNPEDWVKMRSSSNSTQDGVPFETNWVENLKTGQRVEFKTKYNGGQNGIWYHY